MSETLLSRLDNSVILAPLPRTATETSGQLVHGGPGLTLFQFSTWCGRIFGKCLDNFFKGPLKPASRIVAHFNDPDVRQTKLYELYETIVKNGGGEPNTCRTLHKHCHQLLKYASPKSQSVQTQLVTFRIFVDVITRYPGVRHLFKDHRDLEGAVDVLFMRRDHMDCGEEWNFYRHFALFCLYENELTELVESDTPSSLCCVNSEGGNLDRVPVETLLARCREGQSPGFDYARLCAIRYLAGLFELPRFWRHGIVTPQRFFDVLTVACDTILLLIQDIEDEAADTAIPSPTWMAPARSCIDTLASALLAGFIHQNIEALPAIPDQLPEIVSRLSSKEGKNSFPGASRLANFVYDMFQKNSPPISSTTPGTFATTNGETPLCEAERESRYGNENEAADHDTSPTRIVVDETDGYDIELNQEAAGIVSNASLPNDDVGREQTTRQFASYQHPNPQIASTQTQALPQKYVPIPASIMAQFQASGLYPTAQQAQALMANINIYHHQKMQQAQAQAAVYTERSTPEFPEDITELDESIEVLDRANRLFPRDKRAGRSYCAALGKSLFVRFQRLGDLSDLNGSVEHLDQAVMVTPNEDPVISSYLAALGKTLFTRFERLGDLSDLNKSVQLLEQAVELTPDGHPAKPSYFATLGNTLFTCFERLGDLSDLNRSVQVLKQAVELTSDDHPGKPSYSDALGKSLLTRFEQQQGEVDDLNQSIQAFKSAIELSPLHHTDRLKWFRNLDRLYRLRFKLLGDTADLNRSKRARDAGVRLAKLVIV